MVGSTVGSISGDVNIIAGKDARVTASDIISGKNTSIQGQNVTIEAGQNSGQSKQTYEFKQSGLTVSLGGDTITPVLSAASDVRRISNVSDERLQALYAYKAYTDAKDAYNALKDGSPLSVSVSIGSTKYSTETVSSLSSAQGSQVSAGGNVNITATGSGATDAAGKAADGSVNVVGSGVSGENVTLTAAKDVNLVAADNATTTTNTSSSSSAGVGVQIGPKGGVFVQGSKASGNENGAGTTHTETVVAASDTLTVKTGSDANIVGAQAKGDNVKMEIGGDLNIASQQDTDSYHERTSSAGGTIGLGSGVASSVSASKGKIDSDYASVTDQSGVYAGQGGFDITVGGNTDLKGAVIASEAAPDKNKLSTGTLTWSDIENKAEYKASSVGVNVGFGPGTEKKDQGITPNIGTTASGNAESTTKSAIAAGTIEVRSNPTQDLSGLSRDTGNSLNTLGKIFDKKTVQEQQELAKVFGEVAFKAIGDLGLPDGSDEKVALEAFAGGLMAKLGGGSFASGLAGAGFTQLVMNELANIKDPAALQWASAIVGVIAANLVGGDAQTAAAVAVSEIRNNRLSHIITDPVKVAEGLKQGLKDKGIEAVEAFKTIIEHPVDTAKGIAGTIAEIWNDPSLVAKIGKETFQDYQYRLDAMVNGSAFDTGEQLGYLSVDLGLLLLDVGVASKLVEKVPGLARAVEVLNNERGSIRIGSMTTKQVTDAAKVLGFEKTNYFSHGQPIYKKGNLYITPDIDGHNGGVWKAASSVEDLKSKSTRLGTYDANLNRIGD
ncbi:hemagglutinin repeat-containing protein [Anaeroselena agilis]|uniref:Hemagglutinin repeat-containing protein n=1 Tax=Anaeroselena agilis TaxID=3063788 RepID=A0ABU3P2X7_9FIRM|nr:hemagglutinin repeat-containing protein [Selenomonadales bacterium 4137-cl]